MTAGDNFNQDNTVFLANDATGAGGRLFKPGDTVGGYKLKSLLGHGGMGYVFRAEHLIIGRDYALKLLAAEQLSQSSRHRFEAEGRAIANLDHVNIVKVYNMGLDGGVPFYVMDVLDGASLADCIASNVPVGFNDCLKIFVQIASGLAYAHGKGIVHRDVKPSNIILVTQQNAAVPGKRPVADDVLVKIVDFGIAKITGDARSGQSQTATGEVFGSPFYMSPEQCMGERVDARSDIYSLGCTLFETLSGAPPYQGENALQTVLLHQNAAIPGLCERFAERGYPPGLDVMLAKMLAKRPGDRYQTMQHVLHDLGRLQAGKTIGFSSSLNRDAEIDAGEQFEATEAVSAPVGPNRALLAGLFATLALSVIGYFIYVKTQSAPAAKRPIKVAQDAAGVNLPVATTVAAIPATGAERTVANNLEEQAINGLMAPVHSPADIEADRRILDRAGPIVSHQEIVEGRCQRVFSFPPVKIGYIEITNRINKDAIGKVSVPCDAQLYLKVKDSETIALDYPGIFKKVGPEEFDGLKLVGHSGMKELAFKTGKLPEKQAIAESGNEVAVLKNVQKWTRLNVVALDAFIVKPATLDALDKLVQMRRLELVHCIWKAGYPIKARPYLERLNSMELSDTDCTEAMAAALSGQSNLHYVKLSRTELSAAVFKSLGDCPKLTHIELDRCEITEPIAEAIVGMKYLQKVIISTTVISARVAKILASSTHLKSIALNNAFYTHEQQADINAAAPGRIRFTDPREY